MAPITPHRGRSHRLFLSSSLEDYLKKYWCVVFSHTRNPAQTQEMRYLLNWYATRHKLVYVDRVVLPASSSSSYSSSRGRTETMGDQLDTQIGKIAQGKAYPLLFVNKKLIGEVDDMRRLERQRLLKDLLHFGFEWQTGREDRSQLTSTGSDELSPYASPPPLGGPMASAFADKELFRAQYRGAPTTKPITQLPTIHPSLKGLR